MTPRNLAARARLLQDRRLGHGGNLAATLAEVDLDDQLVYMPMHHELDWERRLAARHEAEMQSQWDQWGDGRPV